jgi:hypothetical protein
MHAYFSQILRNLPFLYTLYCILFVIINDQPTSKTVAVDGVYSYMLLTTQNVIGMRSLWKGELLHSVFFKFIVPKIGIFYSDISMDGDLCKIIVNRTDGLETQ